MLNKVGNYIRWISKKLPCACESTWKRRYYDGRSARACNNGGLQLNNGTTQRQKEPPVPLQCADPFNPNHRRYRTCCCHSKSFTIAFGVIELFIICFILVAVAPDFSTKICGGPTATGGKDQAERRQHFEAVQQQIATQPVDNLPTTGGTEMAEGEAKTDSPPNGPPSANDQNNGTPTAGPAGILQSAVARRKRRQLIETEMAQQQQNQPNQLGPTAEPITAGSDGPEIVLVANETGPENNSLLLLHNVICNLGLVWLGWAFVQMFAVLLLFLGIRRQRWQLLIPHIAARMFCALAVWLVIVCLIGAFASPGSMNLAGHLILLALLFVLFLWISLLLKAELRCAEFVKRSAETGFSISRTRPIGPPTVSQSEERERRAGTANPRAKSPAQMRNKHQGPFNADQREMPQNINNRSMSTEMTTQSRPSTAASSKRQAEKYPNEPAENDAASIEETEFSQASGGPSKLAQRRGNPIGGLPPLRHTFRA